MKALHSRIFKMNGESYRLIAGQEIDKKAFPEEVLENLIKLRLIDGALPTKKPPKAEKLVEEPVIEHINETEEVVADGDTN